MPGRSIVSSEALPRSHYFVTLSRGASMRTVAIRSITLHAVAAAAMLLLIVGLGSTLYVVFHDDLMASLMARQTAMQYAYEDRIAAMRQDLERQNEQSRTEHSGLDARIHDLFKREATLEARAALVADLTGSISAPQADLARKPSLPIEITGRSGIPPTAALGYANPDKPRPLFEPAVSGPKPSASRLEDHAALMDLPTYPIADRLAAVGLKLDRIERDQTGRLSQAGAEAHERASRIRGVIEDAGLSPERYLNKAASGRIAGLGGPFVPLPDGPDGQFGRAVAELRSAAAVASQLGSALSRIPVAVPLSGRPEVTSPFGARLDPFLGRPALHTGVDLREGYGTEIRSTAAGRVVSAGAAGGYGNMVEIDHGSGVTTRYAHMGQIAVAEGQTVTRGTVLGFVGSTGRATGPHLHYEVRIDGEAVDPMRFLQTAGRPDVVALLARP